MPKLRKPAEPDADTTISFYYVRQLDNPYEHPLVEFKGAWSRAALESMFRQAMRELRRIKIRGKESE